MSKMLTAADLCGMLSTSIRTVHRLNSAGKIPAPVRIGGRPRWRRDEIIAWIDAGCPDRQVWTFGRNKEGDRP
jgi:predicted DNA-binding transcriptional regulator AlpA